MKLTIPALLLSLSAAASAAVAPPGIMVIDGDTFDLRGERVRILHIDAPEAGRRARCQAEREAGRRATRALLSLLGSGLVAIRPNGEKDVYGRTLADVSVAGVDVGRQLLASGDALLWKPGRRAWLGRRRHWCGF